MINCYVVMQSTEDFKELFIVAGFKGSCKIPYQQFFNTRNKERISHCPYYNVYQDFEIVVLFVSRLLDPTLMALKAHSKKKLHWHTAIIPHVLPVMDLLLVCCCCVETFITLRADCTHGLRFKVFVVIRFQCSVHNNETVMFLGFRQVPT